MGLHLPREGTKRDKIAVKLTQQHTGQHCRPVRPCRYWPANESNVMEILSRESSPDASYAKVLLVQDDEHFEVEPTENPHRRKPTTSATNIRLGYCSIASYLQVQHRRILELERGSMETLQRLRASEQGRSSAEARTAELQQELENNAGMLHHIFLAM